MQVQVWRNDKEDITAFVDMNGYAQFNNKWDDEFPSYEDAKTFLIDHGYEWIGVDEI